MLLFLSYTSKYQPRVFLTQLSHPVVSNRNLQSTNLHSFNYQIIKKKKVIKEDNRISNSFSDNFFSFIKNNLQTIKVRR